MIELVKATAEEFARYQDFVATDVGPDRATRQDMDRMLPDGLNTKDHHLLSLRLDCEQVGFLWMTVIDRKIEVEAFVLDLVVFPEFRRKGYGRESITQLDGYVQNLGLRRISLTVFDHNQGARALYEGKGFSPVFTRMTKRIEVQQVSGANGDQTL